MNGLIYFGPPCLAAGMVLRNRLTGSICTVTHAGIDAEGRWIHATDHRTGETMVYGESYLNHCEEINPLNHYPGRSLDDRQTAGMEVKS